MSQRRKIEREVSLGRLPVEALDLPSETTLVAARELKLGVTDEKAELLALIATVKADPNGVLVPADYPEPVSLATPAAEQVVAEAVVDAPKPKKKADA